ncbi:MAG: pyridoxamine 5'-phosphate oxidase family protein [Lachnospiraceae bacterium]|nr:pyridoxamine 5'-phosphate oxidase family protein [Lachnospiraceae bacterium]
MPYEMRRSERKLKNEDVFRILREGEYGVLSTCGEDGYPYGVPVNYAFTNDRIVFHCAPGVGHKLKNLEFCEKVSFTVVGQHEVEAAGFTDRYESVICFGSARILTDDAEKRSALLALAEKYSPEYREQGLKYIESSLAKTGICEIRIEHMTGKGNRRNKQD